ncbi:MAG: hypothetical protein HY674_18910 [Chloroflexi bacterium]|nr:hypothetical protein [Chloroflexota bacterium]
MTDIRIAHWAQLILCGLMVLAAGLAQATACAGEMKLEAKLIWGTDGPKPDDPKLKDLAPALKEKLKGVFKWKNYFEVSHQSFAVWEGVSKKVRMSAKCVIEVQNLGGSIVEVKLFGEGDLVVKKKEPLKPGKSLILAGPSKDDTAWFVALTNVTP